ncbi:hypothetical protein [Spiroplasma endosymbiont of Polydrusus pterygomalis]|uniref:hypothetical protein n=1 Tax=Spiroplasma endosymbiont of Polydrusus pterygomalis TaxID=3139327 RepID=UPI003CCA7B1A
MPLSEQSTAIEIEVLNNFLQASLSYPKDNSLPDINLNSLDFNDIRRKLDDSLKENIIEYVYLDHEKNLIKESNQKNVSNVSVIQKASLLSDIVLALLKPLVIIRSNSDIAQAHLYRKLTENNQIILEYLGKKELPALLLPIQSSPDLANDKADEENLRSDNINIIRRPKPIMTLSFAENGTCYLVIDSKEKTIVPTDATATQHFKNFVVNNCPCNGSLNIEVDESGKVICAYTINNETAKKKYIEIKQDLIDKIEKVVATAYSLQMNISNVPTPSKSLVTENNSFPVREVNASASTVTTTPPLNTNTNQNNKIPTAS